MKKSFFLILSILILGSLALAQDEPVTAPAIDPDKIAAILVFLGGGIVTAITQAIKALLKVTGTMAVIVTGIISVLGTGAYFLFIDPMIPSWNWLSFLLYAVVIFGQATGFFHFYQKRDTPTA